MQSIANNIIGLCLSLKKRLAYIFAFQMHNGIHIILAELPAEDKQLITMPETGVVLPTITEILPCEVKSCLFNI